MTVGNRHLRERFVERLLDEIDLASADSDVARFSGFDTIYFGGGTPSSLDTEQLGAIIERLRKRLPVDDAAHVFLEANPEDTTAEALEQWRQIGVRTLSLGVQSLDDEQLRFLGRHHRRESALDSIASALESDMDTVSVDIIFGMPMQTATGWRKLLDDIVRLGPHHVSCYQLTIHDGTHFGKRRDEGRLAEMPDDDQGVLFDIVHRKLGEAGIAAYEVSNFARGPEHRSQHNQKYWRHVPYLGLGPSAHSFDGERRWWNHRAIGAWSDAIDQAERPVEESERLAPADLALEAVMLGLRTTDGVDLETVSRRFGVALLDGNREAIDRLARQGLLVVAGSTLRPTTAGLAVADTLARTIEIPGLT